MATFTTTRHLLRVSDLSPDELTHLLDLAARMKAHPYDWVDELRGHTIVSLFDKPSTRTRVSFAAAAQRLGMLDQVLRPEELQLGRGETVGDTARTLSAYADAITIRTFAHATVEELAAAASVPVINALTDEHHPCQALADLLTIRERFGRLDGIRVTYVGDANNVLASLVEAAALTGLDLTVATAPGFEPPPAEDVQVLHDAAGAVAGANVVYTDVWTSMGAEPETEEHRRALEPFRIDARLLALAAPDAIFMHCLPAHRGEEVTDEVVDGLQSAVWQQAANRLPTEQALLHALITRTFE